MDVFLREYGMNVGWWVFVCESVDAGGCNSIVLVSAFWPLLFKVFVILPKFFSFKTTQKIIFLRSKKTNFG